MRVGCEVSFSTMMFLPTEAHLRAAVRNALWRASAAMRIPSALDETVKVSGPIWSASVVFTQPVRASTRTGAQATTSRWFRITV